MTLDVRTASIEDLDSLLPVFREMEEHYEGKARQSDSVIRERLEIALARTPPGIILTATIQNRSQGFVSSYETFPGRAMQSMWYMKELFVCAQARGVGVGAALVTALAQEIVSRGGTRIEFSADAANKDAQAFYEKLWAEKMPKVFYRFEGSRLMRLARICVAE